MAQVAEEHIRSMKKEDLSAQHSALVNFFCKALDLRNATKLKVCGLKKSLILHSDLRSVLLIMYTSVFFIVFTSILLIMLMSVSFIMFLSIFF